MGFFDIEPRKPKPTETTEFIIKDKFSYIFGGYEKFIFIDENDTYYEIPQYWCYINESVYAWKCSRNGDRIRRIIEYDKDGYARHTYSLLTDKKLKIGDNV